MHMPTPTQGFSGPPRSAGPVPLTAAVPADALAFDPVQIAWIDAARRDDIDLDGDDPLRADADGLAARGLALRPWRPDDAAAFRALLDDPAVWAHLPEPYPAPLDPAAAAALLALANRLDAHVVRAVCHQGVPVGQLRLDFAAGRGAAELSYWLGRAHWGRGWGSALVAAAARRAFRRLPALLSLIAKVHPDNPASERLLRKAGFRPMPAPDGAFAGWRWFRLRRQALRG